MRKLYLEGTKTMVLEDEKELKLDYYLVEDFKDHGHDIMLYGIKIVQHMDDYLATEYLLDPISYSRCCARNGT